MEGKNLQINQEYLEMLIRERSKTLVGKALKRFEISHNLDVIKSEVRELIYEEFRTFRELLIAHNYGLDMSIINFKNKRVSKKGEE